MTRARAVIATVVAAGVSLGASELLAGLSSGIPSSISAVGTWIVDNVPGAIERWAIATFGTNDKAVLAIGTVLVVLAIAALVGLLVEKAGIKAAVPWFVGIGVVALIASLGQPLINEPLTVIAAFITIGAGLASLGWLAGDTAPVMAGVRPEDEPTTGLAPRPDRRQFLVRASALGAVAAAGGLLGRRLLTGGAIDDVALGGLPQVLGAPEPENFFDIEGLESIVVPNDEFYRIDTALIIPRISVDSWTLGFDGFVSNPYELTFDEISAMPLTEEYVTIACVSNEVGGGLVGNAKWTGVPLRTLLDEAGPTSEAEQVVGWSVDGWASGFPIEAVYDGREPLVAIAMNDEPLPARHGFPARLIVPGLYGYVSATKWLERVELTSWLGFDSYWVPRGWAKEGPIKTQSRIDVPRSGTRVAPGAVTLAGVAWAPLKGIEKVEVQVAGQPWQEAEITEPLSDKAWVQWKTDVMVEEGLQQVRVRATDGTGETQTEQRSSPAPDGATGWHTIRLRVEV